MTDTAQEAELDPGYLEDEGDTQIKDGVNLKSSEALGQEELWVLGLRERFELVVLIGEFQVGKTSLIAQLYERFLKGQYAGFQFVGSETLTGFARRHHLALVSSGRASPSTPRTSRAAPVQYLHLKVKNQDHQVKSLLLSDRSGEAFEAARTNTDFAANLDEISQADRICFLLDASKIVSDDTRADYGRHFKTMIRTLKDNCQFRQGCIFEVLVTKIDKVKTGLQDQLDVLEAYEKTLADEFSQSPLNLASYRISAVPRENYSMGQVGLEELFIRWLAPKPLPECLPTPAVDSVRQMDRAFARWAEENEW